MKAGIGFRHLLQESQGELLVFFRNTVLLLIEPGKDFLVRSMAARRTFSSRRAARVRVPTAKCGSRPFPGHTL